MWREASHPCVLSWSNPGPWSAESSQISCCLSRFLDNPGEDNGQVCVAAWHCVALGTSLIDLMSVVQGNAFACQQSSAAAAAAAGMGTQWHNCSFNVFNTVSTEI